VVAACQIDLIGVPQPVSAERPMAAPNGGSAAVDVAAIGDLRAAPGAWLISSAGNAWSVRPGDA